VDYVDRLRRLAISDAGFADDRSGGGADAQLLDPKTLALVRLAALVAVGGAGPSYGAHADAAVSSGASPSEIVGVLVGVVPVVGLPHAVSAAPKVALALGFELDDALEA
jgi:4-carboxymuconolactone decarboxylase